MNYRISMPAMTKIAGLYAAASLFSALAVGAQTEPVVFVHGLGQVAGSWYDLAGDLAIAHPLVPHAVGLPWQSHESSQASSLSAYVGSLPSGMAAVSHSNGGLVVREYVRSTGSPKFNRHLTLGTPHKGAPLAQNALNGSVVYAAAGLATDILRPFLYYSQNDPSWGSLNIFGESAWVLHNYWAQDLSDLVAYLPYAVGFIGFKAFSPTWDVLYDLVPGSSFMSTLNGAGNLSNEAQKLSAARVSISTDYPVNLALWRTIVSTDQGAVSAEATAQTLQFYAWEFYYYYAWHPDPSLSASAYLWEELAWDLAGIALMWQNLTGDVGSGSDGVVPWWSSNYPGGTFAYQLSKAVQSVHHKSQLDYRDHSTDLYRQFISQAVASDLGIAW